MQSPQSASPAPHTISLPPKSQAQQEHARLARGVLTCHASDATSNVSTRRNLLNPLVQSIHPPRSVCGATLNVHPAHRAVLVFVSDSARLSIGSSVSG